MAEAKTKSENMIQGIILNAFAIAMGFVVYRVITKMLMGGNGIETFASAGGSVYYDQSSCDYIQNTYGQTCSEYCESNYGEGAWSNCLGDINCGSSDVGSCNEGMATQNGSYIPEIQTLSNDIATISAQPSERMLPNKFAQMAYRSDVSDSSSMPIKQRNLSFKF